jgi:hypothetical protein
MLGIVLNQTREASQESPEEVLLPVRRMRENSEVVFLSLRRNGVI